MIQSRIHVLLRSFILIALTSISFENSLLAQYSVDNYIFQQQTGTYSPISEGTILGDIDIDEQVFNGSTTGTVSIVNGPGFPIGFPFAFGGQVFTRFAVATNGYIKLGNDNFRIPNSVSSVFSGSIPLSADSVAFLNLIGALHGDLQGQTGSELSFKTIGTEPNRECVIQWKKFRIYLATGDDFNFQIRLKEGSNNIVFSYGSFIKTTNPNLVSVGIRGNIFNVVHMRKAQQVSGETWLTSSKSTDRTKQSDLTAGFIPDNGLEYIFYNPPQTANDIGLDKASLSPAIGFGCQGSTAEPVTVRVINYGDSAQTSLPYKMRVNNGPIQEGNLELNPPLAKNQLREVTLSQTLNLSQPGELNVKIWSALSGDTGIYSVNDTSSIKTTLFAPTPTPSPPIKSYNEFLSKGWKTYRGKDKPKTNDGRFSQGFQFASGTTALQFSAFGSDTIFDWLVSPALQPTSNLRLKFRAAITAFDSITPLVGGIDNDEIRFMISQDCGTTWNTIYLFDNNAVTNGVISNIKKGYSIPIPAVSGPFQIAVYAENKGTGPQNTYNFHLDDLTLNQGNSYDLGTSKVSIDNQNNPNCDQTSFTVKAWLKNEGDSLISSTSASVRVNNLNAQVQDFTFDPALQPGDSAQITFNSVAVTPNSNVRLFVRALLANEDGFSAANDTASIRFTYVGSASPLTVPSVINFNDLPSGVPAGWLVEQTQGSDFKVRVRGTNSTRSLSTNVYSGNKSSFAIAPTTAVLPQNTVLTFDLRLKNDLAGDFTFGINDSVTVSVSTDCGSTWTPAFRTNAAQPFGYNNFQTATVDLSAYSGSAIAFRFDARIDRNDNTGAWVDLDNIGISPNTSAEGLTQNNRIRIFPNPAKDLIHVSGNFAKGRPVSLKILSLNGRLIQESTISGNQPISVDALNPGIYLLEIRSEDEIQREKIVIE